MGKPVVSAIVCSKDGSGGSRERRTSKSLGDLCPLASERLATIGALWLKPVMDVEFCALGQRDMRVAELAD